jgi:hypothetical protein
MRTMTAGHLGEETLIDLMDGVAEAGARAHLSSCLHCRGRLDQASAGLELAREADVPEPSPLFWDSFRRQVDERIEAGDPAPFWKRAAIRGLAPWVAAAATVVAIVAVTLPRSSRSPVPAAAPAVPVLPAWSALPPAEEDVGLDMLAAVVPGNTGLGPLAECDGLGDCLAEAGALSEEDSLALADALRRELGAQS